MKAVKLFPFLVSLFILLPAGAAQAQQTGTITGTVTDATTGETIPGVNVVIEGTTQGAATDADGTYTIPGVEPGTYTLVATFVGYADEVVEGVEVTGGGTTTVDIAMQPAALGLDEVVVVGYGTQQREEVTGSIASVSMEEISGAMTNAAAALQGRVAGAHVATDTGMPGGSMSVNIRGMGTIGDSSPLYVIDGVPVGGSIGNNINPGNIASIEILKDAAAAAIYGARAANGVVLITTKSGQPGETRVSFDASYGMQEIPRIVPMLNLRQWAEWQSDALRRAGQEPYFDEAAFDTLGAGTNWQKAAFSPAPMQNYQLSVSGGSEDNTYYLSGGYLNQKGIAMDTGFERLSFRVNTDNQITDRLTIGNHLTISRTHQLTGRFDRTYAGIINLWRLSPLIPVRNPDGSWAGAADVVTDDSRNLAGGLNEIALAHVEQREQSEWRVLGNLYADYQLLDNLRLSQKVGVDFSHMSRIFYRPKYNIGGYTNGVAFLTQWSFDDLSWLSETTLHYDNTFAEVHEFSALAGFTIQKAHNEFIRARGYGYPKDDPSVRVLDASTGDTRVGGNVSEWSLISYLGRISYDYADKYLFNANFRIDGSSRFGPDHRYGFFPSFSAGWRVAEEPFMDGLEAISTLKLRASWGKLGNQQIGLFSYVTTLNLNQAYILGPDQHLAAGAAPTSLANKDIKWETTVQTDVGIDLGLFQDRITLTADYYIKNTKDMLVRLPIPALAGVFAAPYVNVGQVRNSGFELGLSFREYTGGFTYELRGNFSTVSNEVISLGGGKPIFLANLQGHRVIKTAEGHPIGSFFGYVTDGLFQNWDEVYGHAHQNQDPNKGRDAATAARYTAPGDIRFKDLNGDGVINAADRTFIGSPFPDFYYGFRANASYRKFDFGIFFQGVRGGDIYNWGRRWRESMAWQNYNKGASVLDRWTGPGTSNSMPRATASDPNDNNRPSTRWVEDGSYLRLKTLELGYTFGINSIGLEDMRVYLQGTNLLTFTDYRGMDPEVGGNTHASYRNIDRGHFPQARTYTVGVHMTF